MEPWRDLLRILDQVGVVYLIEPILAGRIIQLVLRYILSQVLTFCLLYIILPFAFPCLQEMKRVLGLKQELEFEQLF